MKNMFFWERLKTVSHCLSEMGIQWASLFP
jgi:hypothetical protein